MTKTREIPAGEFKAKCLKLMDDVQATGEELVITKRGTPVAKLVPVMEEPRSTSLVASLGQMKGSMKITGDIISPVWDENWEEEWLEKWDRRLAEDRHAPDDGEKR